MEMSPTPPQFNLTYDVKPMDIGSGYAAGISEAGKSLSSAISSVADLATRSQTVNDTLNAMQQSKMLSDEQYKAVVGKGLGAREQMLGMYAGQWIANQAAQRQQALQEGKGAVDIDVAHHAFLDTFAANRPRLPFQQGPQGPQAPAQPAGATSGTNFAGMPAQPGPLQSPDVGAGGAGGIYNPMYNQPAGVKIGGALGPRDQIPPGSVRGMLKGQPGYLSGDRSQFWPLKNQ